ncbi:MAG: hypothetical protein J6L83_06025 [Clostridia bacterium]|nr:hypothetical protein [Clostridia bacterium]
MKRYLRILTFFMVLSLLLTVFIGCERVDNTDDDDDYYEEEDDAYDYFPDIERKDYGEDLNFYIMGASNPPDYFLLADEEENDGSPMDEAVFNRQEKVNKFLGIEIVLLKPTDNTSHTTYIKHVENAIKNMDGTMEVLLTHVNGCVANLISDNYLLDLGEFEGIDLEADYWNQEFMDDLEINGNYFLGLSDFNLLYTYVIAFNKDMLALYESHLDKSIYELVKEREWTLDEMISLSNLVYLDATGNGKSSDDTFGITGCCWVSFCGFLTSSNIPMMSQNESGAYVIAINNDLNGDKADTLINKMRDLGASNNAFFDYDYSKLSVPITGGRTLMQICSTYNLPAYLDYNIEFGVIPFPMYDLDQAKVGYKSLQWGGYIGVLSYQKNAIKVAETLELLAFFSENVKITFYEKLLGKQVADMPDDAAMLDIIWDSVATDVGQTFVGAGTSSDRGVCYTVPELMWPSSTQNLASFIKSKESQINTGFKNFLDEIKSK